MEVEDIWERDIEELYNILLTLIETGEVEEKEYEKELCQVKEGMLINIPILYIIEGWFRAYPETGYVIIKGHGRHPLERFFEDKQKREALMRKIIIENTDEGNPTRPREVEE